MEKQFVKRITALTLALVMVVSGIAFPDKAVASSEQSAGETVVYDNETKAEATESEKTEEAEEVREIQEIEETQETEQIFEGGASLI